MVASREQPEDSSLRADFFLHCFIGLEMLSVGALGRPLLNKERQHGYRTILRSTNLGLHPALPGTASAHYSVDSAMKLFAANPSENTEQWFVWDIYEPLPPKPVFFGTMEEAGLVADRLNERENHD